MAGKRMIITVTEKDKRWLENYSKLCGVSMAEVIRKAISKLRREEGGNTYHRLIRETQGIWEKDEGLKYQEKLRSEWR
ncbi:MAG: hypothetical protein ACE5NJ_10550 [Thermodesulfobacteriota bacterium]